MKRVVIVLALASLLLVAFTAPALATKPFTPHDFPSTNELNQANGWPYVHLVEAGSNYITLEFVNDTNSLAFFEVRIDGKKMKDGSPHPVVIGDVMYDGVAVDSRNITEPVVVTETFAAKKKVEIRLALGGERDWDFDWTTFKVAPKH
jgi:hypothetical protein